MPKNMRVKLDDEQMDNIKDTMNEGLYIIKETLIDIFANTAKLNISAAAAITQPTMPIMPTIFFVFSTAVSVFTECTA